jgi:Tfp pilus assembly protein PilO
MKMKEEVDQLRKENQELREALEQALSQLNQTPDTYTQISNLGNPAHYHAMERHLPKKGRPSSVVERHNPSQAALPEELSQRDGALTQEQCFPSSPCFF